MTLRVAMLSYQTCPLAVLGGKDTGGMNVYVRELTRHLGAAGVHVDVFTRSQDEHVPHVLHDLGYGNRVVHIPAGPEIPLPKQELAEYLPEFIANILTFAQEKRLQYDVIHSHYWMSGVAAQALKQAWNAPVVHMFHTLGQMKNRVARSSAEQEGEYRVEGERQVLRNADALIVATLAEKSQLQFLYNASARKMTVIPPGVDTTRFYPIPHDEARAVIGIPSDDEMILFVGRIEPLKGVDTLIRAVAHMHETGVLQRYPHYLSIIGGDPEATPEKMNQEMVRLQRMCRELGIGDMVVFHGKRGQDALPYYYSAASMLVVPSHYESFGMVALEAMACGTPVVASQVGGLAFLVQDGVTGFVVPDGEPDILGDRLTRLISDPVLRDRMGADAARYAQGYAWKNIAAQVTQVYNKVLEKHARPQPAD